MAGVIFIGCDSSKPFGEQMIHNYEGRAGFSAFGALLDEALAADYSSQLEEIKEGELLKQYSFIGLNAPDYNNVIRAIRSYIANLKNPNQYQQISIAAWNRAAEPFVRKDKRYDFSFFGEVRQDG